MNYRVQLLNFDKKKIRLVHMEVRKLEETSPLSNLRKLYE